MYANNRGAKQPSHQRSLPCYSLSGSPRVVNLALRKISVFKLVSVAEQTGLSLALLETPTTGFLASRPFLVTSQLSFTFLLSFFYLEVFLAFKAVQFAYLKTYNQLKHE